MSSNRNRKPSGMPAPQGAGAMPAMPMPQPAAPAPVEDEVKDASPEVEEEAPVVEESVQSTPPDDSVKVVKAPKKGIKVKATRMGFYLNVRRKTGEIFEVQSMDKLGTWMQCLDPAQEKERQAMLREKKKALAGI